MRIDFRQVVAMAAFAAGCGHALAQESFDACAIFTQEDAQKVIGKEAAGEAVNPKAKRPKVGVIRSTPQRERSCGGLNQMNRFCRAPVIATTFALVGAGATQNVAHASASWRRFWNRSPRR